MVEEWNHWEQVAEEIDEAVNKLVRKTAFKIERRAKIRAPVDTGFLRNSIYVRTEDSSDLHETLAKPIFPELPAAAHNEAWIAVGATYGIYVEYGTSHRTAWPFLTSSVEFERAAFLAALEKLANGEGVGGDFTSRGEISI